MKKILLALLVLAFISPLCFAQQPVSAPISKVNPVAVATKTLTGKVESVSLADPVKGIKSEIVIESPVEVKEVKEKDVVSEKDQKTTFLVKSTTTIYDADYKATTLDKIIKDQTIKVKYTTTKDGVNEAISVRQIK